MEIQEIEISRLLPHPKNANVMSKATMAKLRRHIEKTRRYEPLILRPHPTQPGCFELINGHHRKEVLESLDYTHASCIVWELNDAETLMLLATVNRLGGEDAPGKRLELLQHLSRELEASAAELSLLLPEEPEVLAKLLANAEPPTMADAPEIREMPEAFTVFLPAQDKRRLAQALKQNTRAARATALAPRREVP